MAGVERLPLLHQYPRLALPPPHPVEDHEDHLGGPGGCSAHHRHGVAGADCWGLGHQARDHDSTDGGAGQLSLSGGHFPSGEVLL